MSKALIGKLSLLDLEKKYLKRQLDKNFKNIEIRKRIFKRLSEVEKEIKNGKFKLELERKMKNDIKH